MATLSRRHEDLLAARGLDPELCARLGVISHERHGPAGEWISIPIIVGGEVSNWKHRTLTGEKRFSQQEGGVKAFFNHDVLTDPALQDRPLIITEGELDCVSVIQCGYARSVSAPDGAPEKRIDDLGSAKYAYLEHARAALRGVQEIILATDGDGPGANLRDDLALRLGRARCRFVTYPLAKDRSRRLKDLNEVLLAYGPAGVHAVLGQAQWLRTEGLFRMSELPEPPERRVYNVGFPALHRHWNLRPGDLTVLVGIPGSGKSQWLNHVAVNMAEGYGWTTVFCSPEQMTKSDHRRALRSVFGRKAARYLKPDELESIDRSIERHFAFIVPSDEHEATLDWVLENAAAAVIQMGARLVCIDPWNELDHARPNQMSLTEYTGFALKEIKRFAKKYQVAVIIAVHPTKLRRQDDGSLPMPTLYDCSDSANFYNKPDAGLVIYRADVRNTSVTIRVAKSRYHEEIGRPGDVEARFDPESKRFSIDDPERGRPT